MAKILAGSLNNIKPHGNVLNKKVIYHKLNTFFKVFLRLVFLLGIGYLMLYPILFIISGAFKGRVDNYDPTVIWVPKTYDLQAMKIAAKMIKLNISLVSTLKILVPSVLLQMVCTLLAGYGFARFKFRGRNLLFAILVFSIIVPFQNIMVPLYTDLNMVKLVNTDAAFYVMAALGMGIRSGLYIFIMRQFFRNMPVELEEAAYIDGCGSFKTFTKVMLPNVVPVFVTILVFSIVWYWNDYYVSAMLLKNNMPLSVQLTTINQALSNQKAIESSFKINQADQALMKDSILECGCLIVLLPLMVMYIFLQRFFTESIERTGIVG